MTAPTMELSAFATFLSGGTPSAHNDAFWSGPICWASPKDMHDKVISDTQDHISEDAVRSSATRVVPPNTILVVARSGILVRRLPVALTAVSMAFNQDIKAIVVDENVALPEYVAYALMSAERDILSNGVKKGATVHSLVGGYLERLRMRVPPLPEQRRIVDILDRASGIQRLRKAADDKMLELVPSLFVDMFGDPAGNPKGWELGKVADVLVSAEYGSSSKASESPVGVPMLRMGNVSTQGGLLLEDLKYVSMADSEFQKYRLEAGDILFNRTNSKELVGKTGLWDGRMEAVYASYFIRLKVDHTAMLPETLWAFMNTRTVKSRLFGMAKGAIGQANINAKELRSMELYLPPLALQNRFRDVLNELKKQEATHSVANGHAEQLLGSLSSKLLG